jgi:uncharacterized protein (DUF1684 family)
MDAATSTSTTVRDRLDLLDWKRQVFDLYRAVRLDPDPGRAWETWRATRGRLIADHPQSPVDPAVRSDFRPRYFEYDPAARVPAEVVPVAFEEASIPMSHDVASRFTHVAEVVFELHGEALALRLYWLEAYGGGIFLSFADGTSGGESYAAGRYLLDTVKGADLGMEGERLVLDFNFAFNPSCAYDPRWACPLAPAENRLPVKVRAGEMAPELP